MKTKHITKLLYNQFPYSLQIWYPKPNRHDKVLFAEMSERVMSNVLKNLLQRPKSQSYSPWHYIEELDLLDQEKNLAKVLKDWTKMLEWVSWYEANKNPQVIGKIRREWQRVTIYTEDQKFFHQFVKKWAKYISLAQKPEHEALLPVMVQAGEESTWLTRQEFVNRYPHNKFRYRVHLAWGWGSEIEKSVLTLKNYHDAGMIKCNEQGFRALFAGAATRIYYPANVLVESEAELDMIKLVLGPNLISKIVEYRLVSDVLGSSEPTACTVDPEDVSNQTGLL